MRGPTGRNITGTLRATGGRRGARTQWRACLVYAAMAFCCLLASRAQARPEYLGLVPNHAGCITCHNNVDGGRGCPSPPCLNPFGMAFRDAGKEWGPDLAGLDIDGDGCSNGEELGDPEGTYDPEAADWVQPLAEDYCARSPGIATLQECDRDDVFCCPETDPERPRFQCECGESSVSMPICTPDGFLPNDSMDRPTPLLDRTWTPVVTAGATITEELPSCGVGEPDVWFEYRPDCVSGNMVIELGAPGQVVVLTDDGYDPDVHEEIACEPRTTRVEVPAQRVLIRVSGVLSTSIRVTCEPDASASAEATICGNAAPVADGTTELEIPSGTTDGVSLHPDDACPADVEKDHWYEYQATCSGMVAVTARFGKEVVDLGDCLAFGTVDAVMGIYSPTVTCPDRSAPLACVNETAPLCGISDPTTTEVPMVEGERLFIRVGRTSALSFVSLAMELSINCTPGFDGCEHYCVSRATCDATSDAIACTCPERDAGDGIDPARGGSGCELEAPCLDAGLDCTGGRCVLADAGPTCECDAGSEFLAGRCVEYSSCDPTRRGEGYDACEFDRYHTRCVETESEPGYACACQRGYSPDLSADEFQCILVCGDGARGPGEECDDGNQAGGDGCDATCFEEDFFNCFEISGSRSVCVGTCGDGLIDLPFEECDDGNRVPGDGCSATCQDEVGLYPCTASVPGSSGGSNGPYLLVSVFGLAAGLRRLRSRPRSAARRP